MKAGTRGGGKEEGMGGGRRGCKKPVERRFGLATYLSLRPL